MRVSSHKLKAGESTVPYSLIQGHVPGPVVMVVAGIHGNERASVRAAQQLIEHCASGLVHIQRGTLIVVPIAHRKAYKKRIRGVPDLNRTFPRKKGDAASHSASAAIFRLAQQYRPDWYLDLHEANGLSQLSKHVLGQTLISNPGDPAVPVVKRAVRQMNRGIGHNQHRFNVRLHEKPGSSRTAMDRVLGAKTVTVETCWSLPFEQRVSWQRKVIHFFLRETHLMM